jgi:ComF family protein
MQQLINYIFPARCLSCSEYIDNSANFCSNCWNKFHFIKEPYCSICSYQFENIFTCQNQICLACQKSPPNYDFARCLLKYDESNKKLIHNFKYYDKTIIAKPIAKILVSRYMDDIGEIDIIIPAPMNKLKRLNRLYNHAQTLADEVGSLLEKKVRSDILVKVKHTKPQSILSKQNRMKNLVGSIEIQHNLEILDKRILFVDDIMTTGSTASLCAGLLKKAGAKQVIVLCIARRML